MNKIKSKHNNYQFVSMIGNNLLKSPYAVDCSSLPPHSIVAADWANQIHLFSPSSKHIPRTPLV